MFWRSAKAALAVVVAAEQRPEEALMAHVWRRGLEAAHSARGSAYTIYVTHHQKQ